MIDDQLNEEEESFLVEAFKDRRVFVFQDFSMDNYEEISQNLEQLLEVDEPVISHTDLTGNRGVDFKFKQGWLVHVILAFEPKASVDVV